MVNLARAEAPLGEPILSDDELTYLVDAYEASGFTGGINWYRNSTLTRHSAEGAHSSRPAKAPTRS